MSEITGHLSVSLCLCDPPTIHPANICSAPGSALCCTLPGARQQCLWGCFGLSSLARVKPLCSLSGWQSVSPLSVEPRPSLAEPQSSQLCLIIWSDLGNASSLSLFIYFFVNHFKNSALPLLTHLTTLPILLLLVLGYYCFYYVFYRYWFKSECYCILSELFMQHSVNNWDKNEYECFLSNTITLVLKENTNMK